MMNNKIIHELFNQIVSSSLANFSLTGKTKDLGDRTSKIWNQIENISKETKKRNSKNKEY